jgi:hypothetical protein
MEKRLRRGFIASLLSFFLASSRKFPPVRAGSARRSRTTERSESVSEEAEYLRITYSPDAPVPPSSPAT